MKELILNRPYEQYNKRQPYSVYVNGDQVVELENGGQQIIPTDGDEITLKAKLHWCGSQSKQLKFDNRDTIKVNIQGNRFYNTIMVVFAMILITLVALSSLFSDLQFTKYLNTSLIGMMIIYSIYLVTAKKDSWIEISEV